MIKLKKFLDRIIFVKKMKKEDILARIGFWAKSGSRLSFVEDRLGEKTELDAVAEFSVHNQRDDIDGYNQRAGFTLIHDLKHSCRLWIFSSCS